MKLLGTLMCAVLGWSMAAGFSIDAATAGDIARGRVLYMQHCASCHGRDADGKGPLAPALSTPPANLRLLSEKLGNPLPEDQVARFIDGRAEVKAHGPREMPVWGRLIPGADGPGAEAQVRKEIADLVAYLQSIQQSPRTAAASRL